MSYKSTTSTYFDLAMDSIIVMIMLAVMYLSIVKSYDAEHEKVIQLLEVDELSHCYSRRYFDKLLHELIANNISNGTIFSVLIIDIDNFKDVNDSFGHIKGDALITEIGSFLKSNVSEKFYVARYGGDEFIILMPDASINKAISIAEELCEKCRIKKWGINKLKITLSIGVGEYNESIGNNIINEVDQQLYAAKHAGKNQVAYCSPTAHDTAAHF